MDYLLGLLHQGIADETSLRSIFLGVVALTVASLSLGVMYLASGAFDPMHKRLRGVTPTKKTQEPGASAEKLMELLQPLSPLAMPKEEKERSGMRQRLKWAGFGSNKAAGVYYAAKALGTFLLPVLVVAVVALKGGVATGTLVLYAAIAAMLGSIAPSLYVDRALKKRQQGLRHGFPDALDLLIVCVEAGLGLKSAIARVADELGVSHPDLGAELGIVNAEMRAGVETDQALRHLADRTGLEDIRGFVALLSQAMRFGTSVGDTLRVYAAEFRQKRMQKAEEAAGKLSVKLIFPMVLCIFPSFFVVAIGPGIIKVFKAFGG